MARDRKEYHKELMRQRRAASKNTASEQKTAPTRAAQIEEDMRLSFEKAKSRLEAGLTKDLLPGSNAYNKVVTAIADLERAYRKERADRGLDPEHLGAAGVTSYRFICHIGRGGAVNTVQYDSEQTFEKALAEQRANDAEREAKADTPERREFVAELNKEFGFGDGHDTVEKESADNE